MGEDIYRHPGVGRDPAGLATSWIPACAGMTSVDSIYTYEDDGYPFFSIIFFIMCLRRSPRLMRIMTVSLAILR